MTTQFQALLLGSTKGIGSAALKAALNLGYKARPISSKDVDIASENSIELR